MIITKTPLRVSFLGGGTDYPEFFTQHGGAVLGSAIDKNVFFSVTNLYREVTNYAIKISYKKVETCNSINEIQHAPFRECMRWCNVSQDIEVNHYADLPALTGLGSSSAFVVGLLNALNSVKGRSIEPIELAYQAIEIERKILKESVGCQDQTFAAFGGLNYIEFHSMDDIVVTPVKISNERLQEFEEHLLMFFTGIKRRADEMEARQVKRVKQNLEHLHTLRSLVDEGVHVLTGNNDIVEFGNLLHKAWLHKRALDSRISNKTIDGIYKEGISAGASGGKLLGAGGGGFILFLSPPEKKDAIRKRLNYLKEVPVKLNAPGSHLVSNT